MTALPKELQEAIRKGKLTEDQIRELIALEAGEIGLSYEEAIRHARERSLPKSPIGADIELLVQLLAA